MGVWSGQLSILDTKFVPDNSAFEDGHMKQGIQQVVHQETVPEIRRVKQYVICIRFVCAQITYTFSCNNGEGHLLRYTKYCVVV
jgi:hypothetical protein